MKLNLRLAQGGLRRIPAMRFLFRPGLRQSVGQLAVLMALPCGGAALAQASRPVAAAAPASAASAARAPSHVKVLEDDNVRIEETRGRTGAVSKVTVHTKQLGAKDYDVQVAPAGRDPNQDKGSAGRRTWSVLNF
jgi:hypothetical protein